MMEDISKAIELAIAAFKEKFGEDAKLEEGDEVVFQLNNCVLIISIEDNTMKQKFIGGQPIKIDHTILGNQDAKDDDFQAERQ